MRIVVHGQQAFGKSVLEALLERGENVIAVYCAPDPKQGGGRPDPLKEAALAHNLPVYQPRSFRNKPEVWEAFAQLQADLCVMAYVTLFVPEEMLHLPTHGTIQYHPSLLPRHRGPSSINWASQRRWRRLIWYAPTRRRRSPRMKPRQRMKGGVRPKTCKSTGTNPCRRSGISSAVRIHNRELGPPTTARAYKSTMPRSTLGPRR